MAAKDPPNDVRKTIDNDKYPSFSHDLFPDFNAFALPRKSTTAFRENRQPEKVRHARRAAATPPSDYVRASCCLSIAVCRGILHTVSKSTGAGSQAPGDMFVRSSHMQIPAVIQAEARGAQWHSFSGVFAEIGHAWIAVDHRLYLWNFENGREEQTWEEQSDIICAVALCTPRPGMFPAEVQYVMCVATRREVLLVAMAFSQRGTLSGLKLTSSLCVCLMCILLTQMTVEVFTITSYNASNSAAMGRIFLGGSDGLLRELQYSTGSSSWISGLVGSTPPAQLISHSSSMIGNLLSRFTSSDASPLVCLVCNTSTNSLFTLDERSTIKVYSLGSPSDPSKCVECATPYNHSADREPSSAAHAKLVALFPVHGDVDSLSQQNGRLACLAWAPRAWDVPDYHSQLNWHEFYQNLTDVGQVSAIAELPAALEPAIPSQRTDSLLVRLPDNELATQHLKASRKFVCVSPTGVYTFVKLRPVDRLKKIFTNYPQCDSKEIQNFCNAYQHDETICMCLLLIALSETHALQPDQPRQSIGNFGLGLGQAQQYTSRQFANFQPGALGRSAAPYADRTAVSPDCAQPVLHTNNDPKLGLQIQGLLAGKDHLRYLASLLQGLQGFAQRRGPAQWQSQLDTNALKSIESLLDLVTRAHQALLLLCIMSDLDLPALFNPEANTNNNAGGNNKNQFALMHLE
eukprot:gene9958-1796_t